MELSNEFIDYVIDQLENFGPVTVRKMFGGAGLYADGKIFGLLADNTLYLKVDDSTRPKYEDAGSLPLKPFPHRPEIKSYYEVPAETLEDPEELIEWSKEALAVQEHIIS